MRRREIKGLDIRWLASSLALIAIVGVQAIEPMETLLPRAEALPLTTTRSAVDLPEIQPRGETSSAPKIELVSEIASRSLFMKSRGVIAAQSTTTSDIGGGETEKGGPPVDLVGTLLSDRADVALVAEGGDRAKRLQVGDRVKDWQVFRIERDGITLRQDDSLTPIDLR